MGLSASQAQLLTLTTRLNHVQGQLSLIANELSDLSSESSKISSDYTNALNQEKLVYQDDTSMDVSYSTLMNYSSDMSSYLGAHQYVLTDANTGAVIMDDSYLTKCSALKDGKYTGVAKELADNEYAFAAKMMYSSDTPELEAAIANATANGTTGSGTSMKNSGLSYYMQDLLMDLDNSSLNGGVKGSTWEAYYSSNALLSLSSDGSTDYQQVVDKEGQVNDLNSCYNFKDMLKSNNGAGYITASNSLQTYINALSGQTDSVMVSKYSAYKSQIEAALNFASKATYNKFVYNVDEDGTTLATPSTSDYFSGDKAQLVGDDADGSNQGSSSEVSAAWASGKLSSAYQNVQSDNSASKNSIQTAYLRDTWNPGTLGNTKTAILGENYVSAQELMDTFFGYFNQSLNESNAGWTEKDWTDKYANNITKTESTNVTKIGIFADAPTTSVTPVVGGASTTVDTAEAQYYINLYRSIDSAGGWKRADNVDSNDFMQMKIKNGEYSIKEITDTKGDTETTSLGGSDSPICTTEDKDKESVATAEYQQKKDEINYKENILDNDQSSLDTEREEIEDMIQSEKSLIKPALEGFKLFC